MKSKRKPRNYWTLERCKEAAKKFTTRSAFVEGDRQASSTAYRNGWMDIVCAHMKRRVKPNGYWTKEHCEEIARRCKTRTEFREVSPTAYSVSHKGGWLDEVCDHMEREKVNPNGYWTKERCAEEAKKYETRTDFQNNSGSAVHAARRHGWMDEICSHMTQTSIPSSYWTKELCAKEAKKYISRTDFMNGSSGAYSKAKKMGWGDEICSHMDVKKVPNGYWENKERCAEEAKKYNTRKEFKNGCQKAYKTACTNGWMDDICKHMKRVGNGYNRYVYAIEFSDKSVYVGITCNFEGRMWNHFNSKNRGNKSVRKKAKLGLDYNILSSELMNINLAVEEEGLWIQYYKERKWNVLNKAKAGGLGGVPRKWNRKTCAQAAKKCKRRKEFQKTYPGAYGAAAKRGWLDEICSHMPKTHAYPNGYWTEELCLKEAKKYKTREEFKNGNYRAYGATMRLGCYHRVCKHMPLQIKPNGHWDNKSNCEKEAKKFKTLKEFQNHSPGAVHGARRNGWMGEICKHMVKPVCPRTRKPRKVRRYWTKERCAEEANKYDTRNAFAKGSGGAHRAARLNGWLDDICGHMKEIQKPSDYWTKDRCIKAAKECEFRSEFAKKYNTAYKHARAGGWLDEICTHMKRPEYKRHWTKKRCAEEAKKYDSRGAFAIGTGGAYNASRKNDWLDEICGHMKEVIKPAGYWNKERCAEEANKYKMRGEFALGSHSAYNIARANGWLNELCSHMPTHHCNRPNAGRG